MERTTEFAGEDKNTNNEQHLQNGMQKAFEMRVDKDRESLLARIESLKKKSNGILGHWALSKGERNLLNVTHQAEVDLTKTMSAANHSMVAIQCQSAIELTRNLHKALYHTFTANVQVGKTTQIMDSKRKILYDLGKDNEKFAILFDDMQRQVDAAPPALKGYLERNRNLQSDMHFEAQERMLKEFLQGLDMDFKA